MNPLIHTLFYRLMNMAISSSSEIDKKAHGTILLQRLAENPDNRNSILNFLAKETKAVIEE
jgi:hypothetical protein